MLAVEMDVKPRNLNFAKVELKGGINREGAFIRINTVHQNEGLLIYFNKWLFIHIQREILQHI